MQNEFLRHQVIKTVCSFPCLLGICVAFSLAFSSCARTDNKAQASPTTSTSETQIASQNDGPPADVVLASASQVELTAGRNSDITVSVTVKPGYHINGNPSSKFQIATVLDVEANGGVSPGKVVYPPSASKKFSFSPEPIMVYEGEIVIKQELRVDADAVRESRALRAKLKVQPCDDSVCYPPRSVDFSIPINVR